MTIEAAQSDETGGRSILYEQVARHLTGQMEQGALSPGARLPSVRRLSTQMQVSIATVLGAYRLLENQGLIEARPQSGYYVRRRPLRARPPEPEVSRPPAGAVDVGPQEARNEMARLESGLNAPTVTMDLASGEPDASLVPSRRLARLMASVCAEPGMNTYEFPPGCEALRNEIARRSVEGGSIFSPEGIVITNGCWEAVHLCLRAVTQPGDTVALESPTFFGFIPMLASLGLRALELPTHPRDGVGLDALDYALSRGDVKVCLFMPNFSNPLGSLMPDAQKERLAKLMAEYRVPLIEDDINGDLGYGTLRPRTVKSFDREGWVLLCSSFSKTLCPGLRVGYAAAGRFHEEVKLLKLHTNLATATVPQHAVAAFIARGGFDRHLRSMRRFYATQAELFAGAISDFFPAGTKVTRPEGGPVLWIEMPDEIDAMQVFTGALRIGIRTVPGPIFSLRHSGKDEEPAKTAPRLKFTSCLRLSLSTPWSDEVEAALHKLGNLARSKEVNSVE